MTSEGMQNFLRFVTGASVAVCPVIYVEFNSLSGLARRPIAHTCLPMIELSNCYDTYVEFAHEFEKILADEYYTWIMDSVYNTQLVITSFVSSTGVTSSEVTSEVLTGGLCVHVVPGVTVLYVPVPGVTVLCVPVPV